MGFNPKFMDTHSTGVYITVNSYSLDAHLLTRLDHLMGKQTTLTLMSHSTVLVAMCYSGNVELIK